MEPGIPRALPIVGLLRADAARDVLSIVAPSITASVAPAESRIMVRTIAVAMPIKLAPLAEPHSCQVPERWEAFPLAAGP